VILNPSKRWQCPSCDAQHVTTEARPHTPFHSCRGQKGLTVPYVEVSGVEYRKNSSRHVVVERGDWVGSEKGVRTDAEGKAVMAVRTERADGSFDCAVFAPSATARAE
jgi:hypothetical protein